MSIPNLTPVCKITNKSDASHDSCGTREWGKTLEILAVCRPSALLTLRTYVTWTATIKGWSRYQRVNLP